MSGFKTPFINVWNPICRKYQWLRTVYIFSISDTHKMYKDDPRVFVACVIENDQCKCMKNKYLAITDSQVFRTTHEPNGWKNKVKAWPEPELGEKNVYTNKYKGIDMLDLYNKMKARYPRYVKFDEPKFDCNENKEDELR
jgi:hypothetical protein